MCRQWTKGYCSYVPIEIEQNKKANHKVFLKTAPALHYIPQQTFTGRFFRPLNVPLLWFNCSGSILNKSSLSDSIAVAVSICFRPHLLPTHWPKISSLRFKSLYTTPCPKVTLDSQSFMKKERGDPRWNGLSAPPDSLEPPFQKKAFKRAENFSLINPRNEEESTKASSSCSSIFNLGQQSNMERKRKFCCPRNICPPGLLHHHHALALS